MEPLRRFEDDKKYLADNGVTKVTCPYVIDSVPKVDVLLGDKDIKSDSGIFAVQFGRSDQVKRDKYGQRPLTSPRNDTIREEMYVLGPAAAQITMTGGWG